MQDKVNIAVFVDYDNIEIGVKSTLRREFDVSLPLDALKERGDIVAKFAYANWSRQEGATRQMAENAVQMVQRIPSPRGDKNGADINLALDALEMAFTHSHVNAFAIVSGDSDFIPLVNKLKEYGKTVYVVGGKAFTSTILQQNCHEFVSYESLLLDADKADPSRFERDRVKRADPPRTDQPRMEQGRPDQSKDPQGPKDLTKRDEQRPPQQQQQQPQQFQQRKERPQPLDLAQAMPLVERALQVLERRAVQPQLGLLKSTMIQLDSTFSERAYGAHSFSEFVEKLKKADYVNVTGSGGRYMIERKAATGVPARPLPQPEEALPILRDALETHRIELEEGTLADQLAQWVHDERPGFDCKNYGFQEFAEFLNYAQDKLLVRIQPDEEKGLLVFLGGEFYPPAAPPVVEAPIDEEEEDDGPQPFVDGQPTIFEPNPPPAKAAKKAPSRKRTTTKHHSGGSDKPPSSTRRPPRRKKD
jgi:uncharacterized protein (TIGR00288 family)